MPELVIWKRKKISRLKKDMNSMMERMLGEFLHPSSPGARLNRPEYNLSETDKELVLTVSMPGFDPDNIDVAITGSILSIKAVRNQETLYRDERPPVAGKSTNSFSISISIRRRIILSKVKAVYENGILQVVMPRYSGEEKRGVRVRIT
ncbi:MAG: Hsp20/alpha crystallin family protein [Deltaproteobacteria bacterium]|nr:Hsp20/alpha crystallin family protein [Deltaproteobacteria bacterium]